MVLLEVRAKADGLSPCLEGFSTFVETSNAFVQARPGCLEAPSAFVGTCNGFVGVLNPDVVVPDLTHEVRALEPEVPNYQVIA